MSDFLFKISEKIISDDKLETLYKTKNNLINTIIENFLGNNGESIAEDFKQFNENFETLYNKLRIEQEDNNSVLEAYSLGSLKSIVDVALAYFNIFDIQQKLMHEKWIYECIKNINTCISISEENLKKVLSRNLNTNSEIKLYQRIDYLKENKILIKEKTTNSYRYSLSITARKAFQLYLETLPNNDENINDYVNLNKFYLNLLDNLADNFANNKNYTTQFIISKSQDKISNNFNFRETHVLAYKIKKINYSIKKTNTNL